MKFRLAIALFDAKDGSAVVAEPHCGRDFAHWYNACYRLIEIVFRRTIGNDDGHCRPIQYACPA